MKHFSVVSFLLIVLVIGANAQQLDPALYKLNAHIPESLLFQQYDDQGFSVFEANEGVAETQVYALVYEGDATKPLIYTYGVDLVKIPGSYWIPEENGRNEKGFAWWESYRAEIDGKTAYSWFAKNKYSERYYQFTVVAPSTSVENTEKEFFNLIANCSGIE